MKTKMMIAAGFLLVLALSGAAARVQAQASEDKRPKPVANRPDLAVGGQFKAESSEMWARITNKCKGRSARTTVKLIIYKGATKNSGVEKSIAQAVLPLGPGESEDYRLYQWDGLQGRYLRLEIDPTNTVREASEGNNWWEPDAQPFPEKGGYCDPPYDK